MPGGTARSSSPGPDQEPLLRSSSSNFGFPPPVTAAPHQKRRRPSRPRRRVVIVVTAASGTALLALLLLIALVPAREGTREGISTSYRDRIGGWTAEIYRAAFGGVTDTATWRGDEVLEDGTTRLDAGQMDSSGDENADSFEPLPPRREWSAEDRRLRNYTWETPPVHSSLERMLADLTPAQNRTRQWLLQSRNQTMGGTGIGLGARDPPERIRPAPPLPGHRGADPDELSGPGTFNKGSYTKYADLVEEWRNGQPVDSCETKSWEASYTALHADMLSGQAQAPSLLEYRCRLGEHCGGFADRILGMTSMFLYSVLTKRAFSIIWEQPAPADLIFDSPHIDWSRSFNKTSTTPPNSPIYADERLVNNRTEINAHNWDPERLDKFMPTFVDQFSGARNSSWLQIDFNRGVVMRSFSYPTIKPRLDKLGLKVTTAYACLIKYLFRPKPAVLAFIAQYTSFFALPEVFVIGIQIRTGDLSLYAASKDVINTVEQHSQYFTCADAVARTYADPSQRVVYYLITDSRVLERDALRQFGDRVVVTGLEQAHAEVEPDFSEGTQTVEHAADGLMRTVAESWIFASTDFQIITQRSGFGKIPTWLRGRENTTIPLFDPQTDPDWTEDYRNKHNGTLPPAIDCSKSEAIKTFHEMAQAWSLG
ncbi:hypothetical protein JCM8115_002350 [Rhodotorula mucilaginosa]